MTSNPSPLGPLGGGDELLDDALHVVPRHGARGRSPLEEGLAGGADGLPGGSVRQRSVAFPGE